ncbi:hypothetical protein H8S84_11520 [Pontibacter sp. SD6]|uniref:Uncharacterized protein n=1 Tax=Pontibacter cellulosilyticus TaxID=1720253 RepID=A0A923N5V2_9BACT|nr:hypothetical protein [Pontibacter cellulosilyticus]
MLLLPYRLFAQYRTVENFSAMNAAYLEIAGNGDTYSINFERLFFQQAEFKTGLRIGVGTNFFFLPEETTTYPIVPVEAIGLFGRREKHFEFGLGYTRRFTDDPDLLQNMYFGRLGFRYQRPEGGLVVRVALTPFLSSEANVRTPGVALVPRFGLSVGRSF